MKLSFKNQIFFSFLTVIIITSLSSTFVGLRFIRKSIPIIQHEVSLDLNSAREIYQEATKDIRSVIRYTATRFFLKDGLVANDIEDLAEKLESIRKSESLDILTLVDPEGNIIIRAGNPTEKEHSEALNGLINKVLAEKTVISSTEILSEKELHKEGKELSSMAYTPIIPTPYTSSSNKNVETSGMAIIAAAPILSDNNRVFGLLYGGRLINHNYSIVDKIRNTIYENETYKGKDVGVVSIFQGNLRISTNVKTEEMVRAVGTIVSEEVEKYVLNEGNKWIERAFAVDDWYITAYEPIKNISGENVGILGIGILESKFKDIEKHALWIFLGITFGCIVISIIICFLLTNPIMRPINSLLFATRELADGNFEQQVELKKAPKEIYVLGKAFNFMINSIKERDKQLHQKAQEEIMKSERLAMIGQLAAGVAHEINNPLGGILLFSRLLLKKAPSEGLMRDNLERIEKEAKRCQNIVKGLLEFAREREPKVETIQLSEILEKAINLFENQALFHNIDIVKQYQTDLPQLSADPLQIEQVFVNIIMNAADAINGKGVLTVSTRLSGKKSYVEASFNDTGIGIPPDQLDRVFEPFYTTKGVGHGTGLGLSISYGIIQKHGGTIKVTSTVGKGSTFEVILPITGEET